MEERTHETTLLADRRVHALMGLGSGTLIAAVAIFFMEGPAMWLLLGIAVLDVIMTPYLFGKALEGQTQDVTGQ